eukprot:1444021-Alexandrium_andersonii.AAC.2
MCIRDSLLLLLGVVCRLRLLLLAGFLRLRLRLRLLLSRVHAGRRSLASRAFGLGCVRVLGLDLLGGGFGPAPLGSRLAWCHPVHVALLDDPHVLLVDLARVVGDRDLPHELAAVLLGVE